MSGELAEVLRKALSTQTLTQVQHVVIIPDRSTRCGVRILSGASDIHCEILGQGGALAAPARWSEPDPTKSVGNHELIVASVGAILVPPR